MMANFAHGVGTFLEFTSPWNKCYKGELSNHGALKFGEDSAASLCLSSRSFHSDVVPSAY